jgi:hypothetical protein
MSTGDSGVERSQEAAGLDWLARRRERIRAEIERNRRGGHKVPTWVLALILVGFVALWAAVVLLA